MALTKCPECGKDVSTEADKCPHCGYPIKQQSPWVVTPTPSQSQTPTTKKGMGCGTWILIVFGIFFGIGLIGTLLEDSDKSKDTKSEKEQPTEEQAEVEPQEKLVTVTSPSPMPSPSPTPVDNWHVSRGISEIDDSPRVVLSLQAENEIKGWLAREIPNLIIRCQQDKTELYINTGMAAHVEYGLYGEHTVIIRLDDDKAFTERWGESTDNNALFAPRAISLARRMVKAETMLFGFTPFNSNPVTVRFDLRGLDKHLPELAETCHWSL